MMLNRVQAASILVLFGLLTVPSLAFPGGSEPHCYRAELLYEDASYGCVKLKVSTDESRLEVEIEGFIEPGEYEVTLFKDYYSDIIAGDIEVDEDGNGEETFDIPFRDPDFSVYVSKGDFVLRSGEWVECEKPVKPDSVKISPSTLNLKSQGKWVTVKINVQTDPAPTNFKLMVNGDPLEPSSVTVAPDHVMLKFSRSGLQELCDEGETEVTVSFKIGDETIELTDTIRVINEGNPGAASTRQSNKGIKTNNGKANGKNKNK